MLKPKNVIDREDKGEIVEAEGGGTMTKVYCTAIVLAAGSGKRMGTKVHKQYLQLCEKPVLAYSLQAFQQSDLIDEIILVVGKGEEEFCRTEIVEKYGFFKVQKIICGGEQRYHSVWNGLKETKAGYVYIHDGARPFVNENIIRSMRKFAIAGGVASNTALRTAMEAACAKRGIQFYHPSPIYCTDNAAMIGAAGFYEYLAGTRHGWDLNAVPNLKLGER